MVKGLKSGFRLPLLNIRKDAMKVVFAEAGDIGRLFDGDRLIKVFPDMGDGLMYPFFIFQVVFSTMIHKRFLFLRRITKNLLKKGAGISN